MHNKTKQTLIILFGQAGSGKNYVGEILAAHFGYYFWDADLALPNEMQSCIQNNQPFTQAMRDQFTNIILQKTLELLKTHPKLVIAQALYKESNRQMLRQQFPSALFIHVQSDTSIINQRLNKRPGKVTVQYAQKIAQQFEPPQLSHQIITNNQDQSNILNQMNNLLNRMIK